MVVTDHERDAVVGAVDRAEVPAQQDPTTGSASGPLGCYLVRHKVVAPDRATYMSSAQGVAMGRPSLVHISIGVTAGELTSVRVGAEAVPAGEGTLYVN